VWQIKLSKNAKNFAEQERIEDDRILGLMNKYINYLRGRSENIDVKKMKGPWKGYHSRRRTQLSLPGQKYNTPHAKGVEGLPDEQPYP